MRSSPSRPLPTQVARGGSRAGVLVPLAAATALALACVPMSVLFNDAAWAAPALLTIAVVCGTGALLRALPIPLLIVPFAQTAAFAAFAAWYVAGAAIAPGGWWDSLLVLRELTVSGVEQVRVTVAPVDTSTEFIALVVVLVFLAALLVETLAVGLGMAGLAGVVLLAMAAVPLGVRPDGPLGLLVAAPALGWILLLAADNRARIAAAPTVTQTPGPRAPLLHLTGLAGLAATGAVALVLTGVAASALLPAGSETPWLRSWWNDVRTGGAESATTTIDPFVDVQARLTGDTDQEVLRYRTSDGQPRYLAMTTLESFDGTGWQPYPLEPGAPLAAGPPGAGENPSGGETVEAQVGALGNPYLPLPDRTVAVQVQAAVAADWGWDPRTGDVVSDQSSAAGVTYQAVTAAEQPTSSALAAAGASGAGTDASTRELPATVPSEVAALAAEVTAAAASPYDQATALQQFFRTDGGFRYSLSVPPAGDRDPLLAFLEDRAGFCQQYATAMAVMSRTLGIPARVVVGFTGGSGEPDGTFVVTSGNAHAWPELHFDGVGWIRFEPTPAGGTEAIEVPGYTPPDEAPGDAPEAVEPPVQEPEPEQSPLDAPQDSEAAPAATAGSRTWVWLLIGTLAVAGLAVLPSALRRGQRRKRTERTAAAYPAAAWDEVQASAVDAGIDWPAGRTVRQQAASVAAALDEPPDAPAPSALRRLAALIEQSRYAPSGQSAPPLGTASVLVTDEPPTESEPSDAEEDLAVVLSALDALPRSTVTRVVPPSLRHRRSLRDSNPG